MTGTRGGHGWAANVGETDSTEDWRERWRAPPQKILPLSLNVNAGTHKAFMTKQAQGSTARKVADRFDIGPIAWMSCSALLFGYLVDVTHDPIETVCSVKAATAISFHFTT